MRKSKSWLLVVLAVGGGCEMPVAEVAEVKEAVTTTLFKPYTALPVGSHAAGVAVGDLNGDGRTDVAVTTTFYFNPPNDNTLHVFLQGADGTLQPRVKYTLGQRPESIDIGDINGDGRADVVVGNFDGATIGVLRQNAAGTLDPMVTYPTANSLSVKIGDFNGDGRMDIVGINWGSRGDGVDFFLQNADGTLAAPLTYHVTHGGYDEVDVGDLDGDGRTDVVVMSGQGFGANLSVLLQTAAGTMAAPVTYSVGTNVLTHGVAVGDVSGDGLSDLVVTYGGNTPTSFIARLLQNGSGTLAPAVSSTSYDIPEPVILADLDGDGRKDVVVAHGGWNKVGVYRQTAAGGLAAEELYGIPYASHYQPQGLAAGDINGDTLPDLVLADYNNGLVVLSHVDDVPPVVSVTAPAAGSYYTGLPLEVTWTASDNAALAGFDVSASTNGGGSFSPICTGLPASARSCTWLTPGPASPDVRLRVVARDAASNQAQSEAGITLVAPSLAVTAPAAGAGIFLGTGVNVTWTHNLPSTDTVRVELTRDGGSYEVLAAAAPNSGSFAWIATGPATASARVRVSWNGGGASGTGDPFSLIAPSLVVTAPAAEASAFIGTALGVTWAHNLPAGDTVRVELSRDGGGTYEELAAAAPNSGSFGWTVTGPATATARVRVTWNGGAAAGQSGVFAVIAPALAVTAPAAGASWIVGTPRSVTWTHNLPAGDTVRVELSRNGGATYEVLAAAAPNSGSFAWTVTGAATASARVRVTWNGGPGAAGTSGAFSLVAAAVTVTAPNTAVDWFVATNRTITWSHNLGAGATFAIDVSRDGGVTWSPITGAAVSGGATSASYVWSVTAPRTSKARIRVTSTAVPAANDKSDVNFRIR